MTDDANVQPHDEHEALGQVIDALSRNEYISDPLLLDVRNEAQRVWWAKEKQRIRLRSDYTVPTHPRPDWG